MPPRRRTLPKRRVARAPKAAAAPETALPEAATAPSLEHQAGPIIRRYMLLAMGCGLIPSAVVDMAAVTALEVQMIHELAHEYAMAFPRSLVGYKILISILGSIGPVYLSNRLKSTVKLIPAVGHAASASLLVIVNGASMYAVGKVFQRHFESGGVFLSMDNALVRRFFKEKYEEGRELASNLATP
jgi:uncharacterized protein (DUF697 family)